jgi:electron transfer flavoprotein alpha subunit
VVLVLANTFTPTEGGSGTAEVAEAPAAAESALTKATVAESHEAEAKVVKPALYIGAGISGAIQHRVGMQTAEHVIAINKDPDAPIGEFADLFVVGDLFQIVPALTEEIRRRKGT